MTVPDHRRARQRAARRARPARAPAARRARLPARRRAPCSAGSTARARRASSDLAAAERVRPQSMAQTVAELEAAGLRQPRPDPDDGRRALARADRRGPRGAGRRTAATAWAGSREAIDAGAHRRGAGRASPRGRRCWSGSPSSASRRRRRRPGLASAWCASASASTRRAGSGGRRA